MAGKIIYRPEQHKCTPPGGMKSRPAEPVGSVWECDCGKGYRVESSVGYGYSEGNDTPPHWAWIPDRELAKYKGLDMYGELDEPDLPTMAVEAYDRTR